MAAFKNPDFTSMNLREAPQHTKEEWQKLFEQQVSASYDEMTARTMEHIPVKPF